MNTVQIAQLLAQLLPLGIQLYNEILAANQGAGLKSVAEILAEADANYDAIAAAAKEQLSAPIAVTPHDGGMNQL